MKQWYRRGSRVLNVDFREAELIASWIEGEPGNVLYRELVVMPDGSWVELGGGADPEEFEPRDQHWAEIVVSDPDSDSESSLDSDRDLFEQPPLTCDQKVALWLEQNGFMYCTNWPLAVRDHPALIDIQSIAVRNGWLSADPVGVNNKVPIVLAPNQNADDPETGDDRSTVAKRTKNWNDLDVGTKDNLALRKAWLTWKKANPGKDFNHYLIHACFSASTFPALRKSLQAARAYLSRVEVVGYETEPK